VGVIVFLRFLSIANISIWFGAAVFTVVGLPAVFSGESGRILTKQYAGFAAEAILARYFILQYCCAAIALAHLAIEWLYVGRAPRRFTLWLLIAMACIGLIGGLVAQPEMSQLHRIKYWGKTVQEKTQADKTFKIWHAGSEVANLLVVGGLVVYLWRIVRSAENSRFVGSTKIRS
jgi:hypothetical protein